VDSEIKRFVVKMKHQSHVNFGTILCQTVDMEVSTDFSGHNTGQIYKQNKYIQDAILLKS
jgi:hypothetical protein